MKIMVDFPITFIGAENGRSAHIMSVILERKRSSNAISEAKELYEIRIISRTRKGR